MGSGEFSGSDEVVQSVCGKGETDIRRLRSSTSRWQSLWRASAVSVAALGALATSVAFAASTTVSTLIDTDNNPGTGCSISTANGAFAGVDRVLNTTVIAETTGYRIQSITLQSCVGGTLSANVPIDMSSTPLARGMGVGGTTAVETYLPSVYLPASGQKMRVGITTSGADGLVGSDALTVATGGGPILVDGPPLIVVPTLAKLSLALTALLLALSVWFARRRGWHGFQLVFVAALAISMSGQLIAAIARDGFVGDWTGIAPVAIDPAGDAPVGTDITNLYSTVMDGNVYFRIDIALNAPPVANAQSVTAIVGQTLAITLTGSDYEGSPLTFAIVTPPTQGTLGGSGANVTYTPNAAATSSDSFTFKANDGSLDSAVATVTISNTRAPAITSVNNALFIPTQPNTFTVLANGIPTPTASFGSCTPALPASITFTTNATGGGVLAGNPTPAEAGVYACTVGAINGVLPNASQSFTLTVGGAPVITSAATLSVPESAAFTHTVTTSSVLPITNMGSAGAPPIGTSFAYAGTPASTATISGTPAVCSRGTYPVTLSATNVVATANQNFVLTVRPVNQAPSFTKGADVTVLEDAGAQTVAGWATARNAGAVCESAQTLTFEIVSNSNATLFSALPAVNATSGDLTFTPAANANGTATITVRIKDNGGTADGGVDTSATQSFVINVTSVNDAPSFTKGANQTVLQNAGAQTVANWATAISAGPADEVAQTLTFTATNTNNALFSAQPAIAANGTLTYTPAVNANGVATVSVTLKDNGGTANGGVDTSPAQTFNITVTAVNQVPSFTAGPAVTVLEDAAPYSQAWATAIAAGPANESTQVVNFIVTNTNNPLFSVQPAVSATGVLSFTLTPNANGSAVVSVAIHDDGGTANGGVDTSATQNFTITVTAVNDAPSFTKGPNITVFENSAAFTQAGWATALSAGPADEASQTLSFVIASNTNAALFSAGPAVSPTGSLSFTPTAGQSGVATVGVQIKDNGGTANGGVDTNAVQTFTITVTGINHAPSFTKGADQTVLEDAAAQTVALWATAISDGDGNTQVLTFQVTNNTNAALFSAGPAIAANGALTYTPAANANGSATITINLKDNGGTANGGVDTSAAQTFVINVTAVNDAPSFTKGADQSVAATAGAVTVASWATAISAGPADEAGQTLAFTATNNNNALFTVQPAIAANGTLSYTVAGTATGSATVSVTLKDNGGTANGGVDTSIVQTFTIIVSAGPATHFGFVTPGAAISGLPFNFTVTALDAFGNVATGYRGTVHFTSTDGAATLPADYTFVAADNGFKTRTATLVTGGARTITATDTVTAAITGTSGAITVGAGTATHFSISAPATTVSGAALSFTVTALDAANNTATGYVGTAHFTSTDGAATLPADYIFTGADAGVHTFAGAILRTAGARTITATDTVIAAITGASSSITVTPGAATHFSVSAPASTVSGVALSFTVTALDAANNTATGYLGTAHFTGTDGAATLPADYTFVAGDAGVKTLAATLRTAGSRTITATDTVTAAITGVSSSITVNPGAATHFAVSAPATAIAGLPFNFTVTALDAANNTATGYLGTAHFTSTDGAATLPADYAFVAGDNGVKTRTATLVTGGVRTITATDTLTPAITGVSGAITVGPGTATHFAISAPATTVSGAALSFTVTALDAANNVATNYVGTAHFTSTDGAGTLPTDYTFTGADAGVRTFAGAVLRTAGARTITATDTVTAAITGTSSSITVTPGAATHFSVAAPASATSGTAFNFTVTALDAANNTATGYAGTAHFTSTDGAATLPADATLASGVGTFAATLRTAGARTLSATDTFTAAITGVSGSITVNPGAATHFSVVAPASATGATAFNFTVTALDAANNTATGYLGTVHFTSTDVGAIILPGDYTFVAGDGGVKIRSATLVTSGNQTITATDTVTATITGTSNLIAVSTGPAITSSANATFVAGANSTFTITTTGTPPVNSITLTACSSPLQSGLTFSYVSGTTATISGSATANGTITCTVTASNGVPPNGTQTLTITVNQAPTISAISNSTFNVGVAGSGTFTVTGFPAPMLTLSGCTLPSGLSLVGNQISGTPTGPAASVSGCIVTAANGIGANAATAPFTITIVVPPPVVTTSGGITAFTEGGAPVAVDAALTVSQPGGPNLVSGSVSITGGFVSAQDVLIFTNQNGISGTYTAATGVLALTGPPTSLANYQTALRSITYNNTSQNPNTANRTVTFVVNDGAANSNSATKTVSVTAVNNAPVITSAAPTPATEAVLYTYNATATDVDGPTFVWSKLGADTCAGSAINVSTGAYTFTPGAPIPPASCVVAIQVCDNGAPNLCATQTTTVTITPVNNPPTANPVTVNALAGIPVTYAAGTLGGTDPDATTVTVNTGAGPLSLVNLASVALNADGSFTVSPTPGFSGAASFQYHVIDTGTPGSASSVTPATVTVNVNGPATVFVKSSAAPVGTCGNLGNECATVTAAATVIAATTNKTIFVADAASYATTLTLQTGGRLFGQGVVAADFASALGYAAAIAGLPAGATTPALPAINATRPTISGATTLGSGNTLNGLNFTHSATTLAGTSFGTLTVVNVSILAGQPALTLTTGTAAVTFDSIISTGGATGVNLNAITGSVVISGGAISGSTTGFLVTGGTGTVSYAGTVASGASARSVNVNGKTGGTVTFSGAITDNGTGISLTSNGGATVTFSGGIAASTGTSAAFTATGGGTINVTQNNTSIVNTLTTTAGTALTVTSTTIGGSGLTFRSISSNGAANGINLLNTGAGSFTVTGNGSTCTVATPTCDGGSIQSSTGQGILLNKVGPVSLTRMKIQNSGTRSVGTPAQTAGDTCAGACINGFTMDNSIITDSAGGPLDDGLVLTNVTGAVAITNSAIANIPHNGVWVDNFSYNMSSFTMTSTTVSCAAGQICHPATVGTVGNDGLLLVMRGTSVLTSGSITSSTFSGHRAVGVQVQTGDTGRIGSSSGGMITAPAASNSFTVGGAGVGNTFTGNGQGIDIDSSQISNLAFQILNNSVVGRVTSPGAISNQSSAVAINAFTAAGVDTGPTVHTFVGKIDGNTIGTQGVKDSGAGFGSGIRVVVQGDSTQGVVSITNNTIREVPNAAIMNIFGQNGNGSRMPAPTLFASARFKITGNTMPAISGSNLGLCGPLNTPCADAGIFILADEGSAVCNVITGNSVYDLAPSNGSFGIYLAERAGPPVGGPLTVEGTGGSNSVYIQANNTLAGAQKFIDEGANTSQVATNACGAFPL